MHPCLWRYSQKKQPVNRSLDNFSVTQSFIWSICLLLVFCSVRSCWLTFLLCIFNYQFYCAHSSRRHTDRHTYRQRNAFAVTIHRFHFNLVTARKLGASKKKKLSFEQWKLFGIKYEHRQTTAGQAAREKAHNARATDGFVCMYVECKTNFLVSGLSAFINFLMSFSLRSENFFQNIKN